MMRCSTSPKTSARSPFGGVTAAGGVNRDRPGQPGIPFGSITFIPNVISVRAAACRRQERSVRLDYHP
jgi:hypothetical protein